MNKHFKIIVDGKTFIEDYLAPDSVTALQELMSALKELGGQWAVAAPIEGE